MKNEDTSIHARADAQRRHAARETSTPHARERGQAVSGPAFYIWDEDPRQARQWGAELADVWLSTHVRSS